jgi:thioredoxin reductase
MKPFAFSFAFLFAARLFAAEHDLVIYGGTSAAVVAAVQAKKMGKSVIVVSPDKHTAA